MVWGCLPGISPPLERLHGYNVGKYEVELRSDRLHYRLQSGYNSGYIRIRPTGEGVGIDCFCIPPKTAKNRQNSINWLILSVLLESAGFRARSVQEAHYIVLSSCALN
jgi:hypothetical protein